MPVLAQAAKRHTRLTPQSVPCAAYGDATSGWFMQPSALDPDNVLTQTLLVRAHEFITCSNIVAAMADLEAALGGSSATAGANSVRSALADVRSAVEDLGGKLDAIEAGADQQHDDLTALGEKLDTIAAAVQEPTPVTVDTEGVEQQLVANGANDHADAWFLIGLACALFFGHFLYRAVTPRA